ncbi:MAG: hypothetical protein ACKV2V_18570 [Blastocatellia bacterium]
MKPIINLASRPFRNRRLFWLAVLAIIGISAFFGLRTLDTIQDLEKEIAGLQPQVVKKQQEAAKAKTTTDEVSALNDDQTLSMVAAQDLIQRKAFSWSRLMAEMERHIPPTVKVRKIALKQIADSGGVTPTAGLAQAGTGINDKGQTVSLTFEVTGKSIDEVLKMIETFQHTRAFEIQPNAQRNLEGTSEVEVDLDVTYYPPVPRGARAGVPENQIAGGGKQQ